MNLTYYKKAVDFTNKSTINPKKPIEDFQSRLATYYAEKRGSSFEVKKGHRLSI